MVGQVNYSVISIMVEADLLCCGKGASSSLPLALVLGRSEVMDLPEVGQ